MLLQHKTNAPPWSLKIQPFRMGTWWKLAMGPLILRPCRKINRRCPWIFAIPPVSIQIIYKWLLSHMGIACFFVYVGSKCLQGTFLIDMALWARPYLQTYI
ncbi:X protein [human papillomavirus 81]|uniref:X protein n=1 Tax=human papillomavirus 81 TaxID=333771 RepID=Q705E1_9PAPI|nr:X protein [human papillomavirus 81]